MGKRKSKGSHAIAQAAAAAKRARTTLPSRFECPFCNAKGAVTCELKRDLGRASVRCGACGMGFNTVCR